MNKHKIIRDHNGKEQVVALVNGELLSAGADHPDYDAILNALERGADDGILVDLFRPGSAVDRRFREVTSRVRVSGQKIYLDGEPVDNALVRTAVEVMRNDGDFAPLLRFYERVAANPQEHTRSQLFTWLAKHDFAISEDGFIIAYKGVDLDRATGQFLSRHEGRNTVYVDGVPHTGRIPNNIGSVVEMPRGEVLHDPRQGCAVGLHAGDWSYASDWASETVAVLLDPSDVVSVPTDSDFRKVRTCRYRVLGLVSEPLPFSTFKVENLDPGAGPRTTVTEVPADEAPNAAPDAAPESGSWWKRLWRKVQS